MNFVCTCTTFIFLDNITKKINSCQKQKKYCNFILFVFSLSQYFEKSDIIDHFDKFQNTVSPKEFGEEGEMLPKYIMKKFRNIINNHKYSSKLMEQTFQG